VREAACSDQKLRAEFLQKDPYWTKLMALFEHWSHGKCWYTEAKTKNHGGQFEIDHFRPKLGARDPWNGCREWAGYPWLAYGWENLRLSAPAANRLGRDIADNTSGKGTNFPLRSRDSPYATRADEIPQETPHVLLIDPCNSDEVDDLSFDEHGMAVCTDGDDDFRKKRVERTVNIYNIDHPGLVSQRQEVWRSCLNLHREIKKLAKLEQLAEPGTLTSLLEEKRNELSLKFRADQEFAGMARAFARTCADPRVMVASQNVAPPPYQPFKPAAALPPFNGVRSAVEESSQLAFAFVGPSPVSLASQPKKPRASTKKASEPKGRKASA
jgi:hypothetical protein